MHEKKFASTAAVRVIIRFQRMNRTKLSAVCAVTLPFLYIYGWLRVNIFITDTYTHIRDLKYI